MGGPRYRYDRHRNSDSIWQALPQACWLLAYIAKGRKKERREVKKRRQKAGLIKSVLARTLIGVTAGEHEREDSRGHE